MVELADWGDLLGNIPDDGSNFDESMIDVDNGYFTDDDNQFALDDATHTQARHIRQEWSTREGELSSDIPSEIAIENGPQNEEIPQPEPELDIDQLPAPELFKQEKLVYISFDIETGGEYCGIVQISAQIFRVMNHNSTFESNIEPEIFDEYVKPPDDAIWDPRACDVHGLSVDDERIVNADGILEVWNRFNEFVDRHVGLHQRAGSNMTGRIEVNRSRDGCVKLSSSRVNVKSASFARQGRLMESIINVCRKLLHLQNRERNVNLM